MKISLNRYTLKPGKAYGKNKEEERIVKVKGDFITTKSIYGNIKTRHYEELLEDYSKEGFHEISSFEELKQALQSSVGTLLGPVLFGALLVWLSGKVGK